MADQRAFQAPTSSTQSLREVLFSHPAIQVDAHSEYLENEEFVETADASLA